MEKEYEYRTLEQGLQELCDMFWLKKDKDGNYFRRDEDKPGAASSMVRNQFLIDKKHFTRDEVISMLQDYFDKYRIEGCYCSILPITFVWTEFSIKPVEELSNEPEYTAT